jgi:purine-nucleoside phosphorylase
MSTLKKRIDEAAGVVRKRIGGLVPEFGIILGTGLGNLARKVENAEEIPYADIPHFPASTVASHAGQIVAGTLSGKPVLMMEGRFHFYEGYSLEQVTFPVRVMKALGAKGLIVTNACGGMNPMYDKGDIVMIEDHINLMGVNPLIGSNDETLGPRFPDMCQPYDRKYLKLAETIALKNGIRAHRGVFVALTGPCLETRAEYRMLRILGADTVGMSTVPEVTVAVHAGLKTLGMSVVTDVCLPDALAPVKLEEIIAVANEAGPKLEKIIANFLAEV